MYSIIKFQLVDNLSSFNILFTKTEMDLLKSNFTWIINSDNVYPKFNYLEGSHFEKLNECFPFLRELFSTRFRISFDQFGVDHCSTLKYLIEFNFPEIESKCAYNIGTQTIPLNGRVTFLVKESFFMEWYHEFGLVRKYDFDKNHHGFYHPKTHKFLFNKTEDFLNFKLNNRKKKVKLMKKYNSILEENNLFIRLLNVYDKQGGHLKYRITNQQFDANSIGILMLKSYDDDDELFMRSYEVTSEMCTELSSYYDGLIDFNFELNRYFFETMDAKDFVTSYDDFIQNLNIEKPDGSDIN